MSYIKRFSIYLVGILLSLYLIFQIPLVRQYVIKKSVNFIGYKANINISYEKCNCKNFNDIKFENIVINSNGNKELLKLQQLQVILNLYDLIIEKQVHIGTINLEGYFFDNNTNTSFDFSLEQLKDIKIKIDNFNLINFSLSADNQKIVIPNINTSISNIFLQKEGISFDIKNCSAKYKDLSLQNMKIGFSCFDDVMKINDLSIISNLGNIDGSANIIDFNSNEKIHFDCNIKNCKINTRSLQQYNNFFKKLDSNISIKCNIEGNLQDAKINSCQCKYKNNIIHFDGIFDNFTNLKQIKYGIDNFSCDIDFKQIKKLFPPKYSKYIFFHKGKINGNIEGIGQTGNAHFNFKEGEARINSDISFTDILSENFEVIENVELNDIDIDLFKLSNINAKNIIKFSKSGKSINSAIKKLQYDKIAIENIVCEVEEKNNLWKGFFKIKDNDIATDLRLKKDVEKIYIVGNLNLNNINKFYNGNKLLNIQNDVNIEIKTKQQNLTFECINNKFHLGNKDLNFDKLKIALGHKNEYLNLDIQSDPLSVKILNVPKKIEIIKDFILQIKTDIKNVSIPTNHQTKVIEYPNFRIPLYINIKNDALLNFIFDDISCEKINIYGEILNTNYKKTLNFNNEKIKKLKIGNQQLSNVTFDAILGINNATKTPIIDINLGVDKFERGKLEIEDCVFKIENNDKKIFTATSLKNKFFTLECKLNSIIKDGELIFDLKSQNSECSVNKWSLEKKGCIKINKQGLFLNDIAWKRDEMSIFLEYKKSFKNDDVNDNLLVVLKDLNIGKINIYSKKDINGILNAKVNLDSSSTLNIVSNLNDLKIENNIFGNIDLKTKSDIHKQVHNYDLSITKNDNKTLQIHGIYENKNQRIFSRCIFDNFSIQIFEPFASPAFDRLSGFLKGDLIIKGNLENPIFVGDIDYIEGNVSLPSIKTKFKTKGHFRGDQNGFIIRNLCWDDEENGHSVFEGKININFKEMPNLDIKGNIDNIHILSTKENDNDSFYGDIFCSGTSHIFGPVNYLTIAGNLKNDKNSNIFINSDKKSKFEDSFIHFIDEEDIQNEEKMKIIQKEQYNGINLNLNTYLNKDLKVSIKIPTSTIFVRGNGPLHISTSFNDNLDISGTYNIEKGAYILSLKNTLNKKFKIQNGGKINFVGDIKKTFIDVKGNYNLSVDDTNDNVTLNISVVGEMMKPNLQYDIDLSKSKNVSAEIIKEIKTNKEQREVYFINLLLFKNFKMNTSNLLSKSILNFLNSEENIKKQNWSINIDFDQLLHKDHDLNITYNIGKKLFITKKQKLLSERLSFEDLRKDLQINYLINDNMRLYLNTAKERSFNLGFSIIN